jgi:hypothetical protein
MLKLQKKHLSASSWFSHFLEMDRLFRTSRLTLALIPPSPPFEGIYDSSIAFANVVGNGDPDVLITGLISSFALISKRFRLLKSGRLQKSLACNLNRMITILSGERLKQALLAPFWDLQAGKDRIRRSLAG